VSRPPDGVALLDWDNSLHDGYTMGPWLHALARDARESGIARRFDAARAAHEAGDLPYDRFAHLAEELYTGLAEGRQVADFEQVALRLVPVDTLRPGTPDLVAALRAMGIRPILISGAPIEMLRAHAAALGLAPGDVTGWVLERAGDRYVGRLASGNTARGGSKAAIVARLLAQGARAVLGVGDSEADRPLVDAARIGAWVDPRAPHESARVRWTDRALGTSATGSLADLAAAIRGSAAG
jgi:phosphoserine phosphatase